jgi:hypothetical protein
MNNSDNKQFDTKLQISFPKSSEDHRLQLVDINGSIFAILFSPLESEGPIRLDCSNWSLVLLAPIKSKTNVLISGINVICLSEIISEEGMMNIHASNRLVKFAGHTKKSAKVCEMGESGEFRFHDDPAAFLFYYRLFENLVKSVHLKSDQGVQEAQQRIIMGLCSLAQKIDANANDLSIHKVLNIWNIPALQSEL